jgi:hypothetical protein
LLLLSDGPERAASELEDFDLLVAEETTEDEEAELATTNWKAELPPLPLLVARPLREDTADVDFCAHVELFDVVAVDTDEGE